MLQENDRSQRLARLVRRLRGDASTYVFGSQLGVTHSTIRRWESGQGGINEEGVEKLSHGSGISADAIRAYLRGSIGLRTCLGLEAPTQSEAQLVLERLPTLPTQELLRVLEAAISQLLQRLPDTRPEILQILQSAIGLLSVSPSSKRSRQSEPSQSAEERYLPRTIQDAIIDEIESRYGNVNSITIQRFAQEVGIQPVRTLFQVLQGQHLEQTDLIKMQQHLYKYFNQLWDIQELRHLIDSTSGN